MQDEISHSERYLHITTMGGVDRTGTQLIRIKTGFLPHIAVKRWASTKKLTEIYFAYSTTDLTGRGDGCSNGRWTISKTGDVTQTEGPMPYDDSADMVALAKTLNITLPIDIK